MFLSSVIQPLAVIVVNTFQCLDAALHVIGSVFQYRATDFPDLISDVLF